MVSRLNLQKYMILVRLLVMFSVEIHIIIGRNRRCMCVFVCVCVVGGGGEFGLFNCYELYKFKLHIYSFYHTHKL